jgi:hypothetical protein
MFKIVSCNIPNKKRKFNHVYIIKTGYYVKTSRKSVKQVQIPPFPPARGGINLKFIFFPFNAFCSPNMRSFHRWCYGFGMVLAAACGSDRFNVNAVRQFYKPASVKEFYKLPVCSSTKTEKGKICPQGMGFCCIASRSIFRYFSY